MRRYFVTKSSLKGTIAIPPSKSQTLRAILFGALGCGTSAIENFLASSDTESMIEACRSFGAKVDVELWELMGGSITPKM
jgi:3-phosphoshikimate 1-carboxyvinyltransferase